jgi:NADH dehydrogenase (ubiquinone) flavoprotein 2
MISQIFRNLIRVPRLLQLPRYQFTGYVSHRERADNNDSTPFEFTEENYKLIDSILKKYPPNWKRSAILPLLHLAQKQNHNFLPLSAMKKVAKIV